MALKKPFKVVRVAKGFNSLVASGYDREIGTDHEQKITVFLNCQTPASARKKLKVLAEGLNKVWEDFYNGTEL